MRPGQDTCSATTTGARGESHTSPWLRHPKRYFVVLLVFNRCSSIKHTPIMNPRLSAYPCLDTVAPRSSHYLRLHYPPGVAYGSSLAGRRSSHPAMRSHWSACIESWIRAFGIAAFQFTFDCDTHVSPRAIHHLHTPHIAVIFRRGPCSPTSTGIAGHIDHVPLPGVAG